MRPSLISQMQRAVMKWKKAGQRLPTWTVKRFLTFVSLAFQGLSGEEREDPSQVLFPSSEPSRLLGSWGGLSFLLLWGDTLVLFSFHQQTMKNDT